MPRAALDFPPPRPLTAAPLQPFPKHDANRAPRFWHVAVTATKGLFNQPTRVAQDNDAPDGSPVPRVEDRRKRVRRSVSTPALKASASTANVRRDMVDAHSPPVPPLFTSKRSFEQSPRKNKFKGAAVRRPAISSPSLPKSLDTLDSPHPKLAYPLSPMPSPVGSTFSLKTPAPQASQPPMSDDVSSVNEDICCDTNRPVRRRTKSAPGTKLGKRSFFSPVTTVTQEPGTSSIEACSPIVIDIASPSIASPDSDGSLPSPPLETPRMTSDYLIHKSSPLVHAASPRSFTSVKRKPVPRHLYTDPPEHDASAPCTPIFTPNPGSSPYMIAYGAAQNECSGTLHTPLLPSSELILNACNPSRMNNRGLNLLPIGQMRPASRRQHRRSVSEHGCRRLLSPDAGLGLPSPWFTTNANGSMTPLITPAEEQPPFSFANDLPAAPRSLPQSPPQTPTRVSEEISAFSDNTSARSSIINSGALSPLTDDEIDAIRTFLRRHATGHRARQRRKASKPRRTHSRDTSVASCSYDMHTQILESYATDEDEFFSIDGSEDDTDAESHMPMSASETHSISSASLNGPLELDLDDEDDIGSKDFDVETPVIRNEIETTIDTVNRGTFGYYGTPMGRMPRSYHDSNGVYAPIPGVSDVETRPCLPTKWMEVERTEKEEDTDANARAGEAECDCSEDVSTKVPVTGPPRSSSMYYRSSSDYARGSDDDDSLSYLRISRQPLVPRMLSVDSESDHRMSSSTSSLSPSTSTGRSAFASGIGLAIIPPEHFAHFDEFAHYEYTSSCSPSDCGTADDLDGSPSTLACASHTTRAQRRCNMRRNNLFDGLRTDLTNLQTQAMPIEDARPQVDMKVVPTMLKPALQISANLTFASTMVQLPSPTDTIETYPPQNLVATKNRQFQKNTTPDGAQHKSTVSVSADEAIFDNVKSFMNLTPNEPAPKRSRVRLRQLFTRAAGRKVSAESKH